MRASLGSHREKARGREQKRRGRETGKEEKSGRRKRRASGSKSVRSGQSSYPGVCLSSNGFGTKVTAPQEHSILLWLDSVRDKISRTAFQLWLHECLKK